MLMLPYSHVTEISCCLTLSALQARSSMRTWHASRSGPVTARRWSVSSAPRYTKVRNNASWRAYACICV